MMERIKAKLGDPDKNVRQNALKAINWHVEQHTRNASDSTVQPVIDTLQFILNCILIKKDPGDTFRQDFCMNINYNAKALNDCDQFPEAGDIARSIIGLGTKAASLVSTLKELAIKIEKDVGPWYNAINLLGIIGVPAIQALKYVLVYYHNTEKFEESILLRSTLERAFREIGRPACDALAEYRGFFAPSRLKAFAKALNDDN